MEIASELDALMVAAQQTLSLSRDAEERISLLREELVLLESELARNEEIALALTIRLKEVAARLGLVTAADLVLLDAKSLDEIESLVDERRQHNQDRPIPQNVIFLAEMARQHARDDAGASSETVERRSLADAVDQVLASITPREARVLRMRFGLGGNRKYTLSEVGEQFKVTGERIRQVEARALRKLRSPSRSGVLRPYLGSLDFDVITTPEARILLAVFGYR